MDERAALRLIDDMLQHVGDDAAVVDGLVMTVDMLHDRADFPAGTGRYTAGWRAVGASLSDVAAMGARATATVAAYGAPSLHESELREFVRGAVDVSTEVGADYVGGDLDVHDEFTVATAAIGRTDSPVRRRGCSPGERVVVTGELGRTAAAMRAFEAGDVDRGNKLFRFVPRVAAGQAVAGGATAMMDSSDGLARSLHQLAEANGCGFAIEWDRIPVHSGLAGGTEIERREGALAYGEDFELVICTPADRIEELRRNSPVKLSDIGRVAEQGHGITVDGEPLPDQGYTHGSGGANDAPPTR